MLIFKRFSYASCRQLILSWSFAAIPINISLFDFLVKWKAVELMFLPIKIYGLWPLFFPWSSLFQPPVSCYLASTLEGQWGGRRMLLITNILRRSPEETACQWSQPISEKKLLLDSEVLCMPTVFLPTLKLAAASKTQYFNFLVCFYIGRKK